MIDRSAVDATLDVVVGHRGVRGRWSDSKKVVPGTPDVIEPDIRVRVLVKELWKVSLTLEPPI